MMLLGGHRRRGPRRFATLPRAAEPTALTNRCSPLRNHVAGRPAATDVDAFPTVARDDVAGRGRWVPPMVLLVPPFWMATPS